MPAPLLLVLLSLGLPSPALARPSGPPIPLYTASAAVGGHAHLVVEVSIPGGADGFVLLDIGAPHTELTAAALGAPAPSTPCAVHTLPVLLLGDRRVAHVQARTIPRDALPDLDGLDLLGRVGHDTHGFRIHGRLPPWIVVASSLAYTSTPRSLLLAHDVMRLMVPPVGAAARSTLGAGSLAGRFSCHANGAGWSGDTLSRFSVVLDEPRGRLLLRPPSRRPANARAGPRYARSAPPQTVAQIAGPAGEVHTLRVSLPGAHHGQRLPDEASQVEWLGGRRLAPAPSPTSTPLPHDATDPPPIGGALRSTGRLVLDYPHRQVRFRPARRPRPLPDARERALALDRARHGDTPDRGLHRARLLRGLERPDDALAALRPFLDRHPDDPEAHALAARLALTSRTPDVLGPHLARLSVLALHRHGLLLAAVHHWHHRGEPERAWRLATEATVSMRDAPEGWIAPVDLRLREGAPERAWTALQQALDRPHLPGTWWVRRAHVAWALGDVDGALSQIRRAVEQDPSDAMALRLYAEVARPRDHDTLAADLRRLEDRAPAPDRPWLSLTRAYAALGASDDADRTHREGMARDCRPRPDRAARRACAVGYHAARGQPRPVGPRGIDAIGQTPAGADALALHWAALGASDQARHAARHAAQRAPGDGARAWLAALADARSRRSHPRVTP